MSKQTDGSILVELKQKLPNAQIWVPNDDDFEEQTRIYVKQANNITPLALVRPRSENEVASVVEIAHKASVPLAIRVGGHDLVGRSRPDQALILDLREFKDVEIVDEGQAAIIGGGILAQDLADALAKTGHATTYGNSGTVGFAGWAVHGGYGPFMSAWGLGVDQILAARVVNYRGEIVDADVELLFGLR